MMGKHYEVEHSVEGSEIICSQCNGNWVALELRVYVVRLVFMSWCRVILGWLNQSLRRVCTVALSHQVVQILGGGQTCTVRPFFISSVSAPMFEAFQFIIFCF